MNSLASRPRRGLPLFTVHGDARAVRYRCDASETPTGRGIQSGRIRIRAVGLAGFPSGSPARPGRSRWDERCGRAALAGATRWLEGEGREADGEMWVMEVERNVM